MIYIKKNKVKYYINTYLVVFVVFFFVLAIILFPNESVKAAHEGLMTWLTVVLPALLPFFIGAELLIGLGVVKFIGVLLEPLMRPLFNVPGEGSFAFTMSVTSGYPVGAKIITKLRLSQSISKIEAQRLASFCSTSGPLFIVGAVGIGMFKSKEIGYFLAFSHYLAAICVGLLFAFYRRSTPINKVINRPEKNRIREAFRQLSRCRRDNPPFGVLLGNAVKESFNTMLMVGGFIILFSVIIKILGEIGFIDYIAYFLHLILRPLNMSLTAIKSLIVGLFEITIGGKMVAESMYTPLITKVSVTAFIIAWSGFSIHAQCISLLGTTDLNINLYLLAKLIHATFAGILSCLLFPLYAKWFQLSSPVFFTANSSSYSSQFFNSIKSSLELFVLIFIGLLVLSLLFSLLLSIRDFFKKRK